MVRPVSVISLFDGLLRTPFDGFDCWIGRSQPRRDGACRRARDRQGRFAPLARWPEDGPSLTAAARAGVSRAQVGTEGWRRSNKRMAQGAQRFETYLDGLPATASATL